MLPKFAWPRFKTNQNTVIIGPKGSGKTEVLRAVAKTYRNLIVIDNKKNEDWSDVGLYISDLELTRIRGGRFIWSASKDFVDLKSVQSEFFEKVLDGGNRGLAIDELSAIFRSRGFNLLVKQGRAAHVPLLMATQRPCGVPLESITEADHFFIFFLRHPDDRKRVAAATGLNVRSIPWKKLQQQKHSFVYIAGDGTIYEPTALKGPFPNREVRRRRA